MRGARLGVVRVRVLFKYGTLGILAWQKGKDQGLFQPKKTAKKDPCGHPSISLVKKNF
jgi:hypothetical protein